MATDKPEVHVVWGDEFSPDFAVVSATIEDHDRMIDKATIVFDDPNSLVLAMAVTGTTIRVTMGWEKENAILFHGRIADATGCVANGAGQTTVTAYDDGIVMHQERRPGSYVGSLKTIVEEITMPYGADFGLKWRFGSDDPDPIFTDKKPLVRSHLTDYEFLNQLALHYGGRSFVEWDDEVQRPVYWFASNRELYDKAKPSGVLEYCCGYSKLLEFTYEQIASKGASQVVDAVMDPDKGTIVESVGPVPAPPPPTEPPPDAPTEGATAEALTAAATKAKEKASTPPKPRPLGPQPSDKARSDVLTIRDPTRASGFAGKGRAVGTVMLRAKSKVTIKGIASWAEGDWYVGLATHRYQRQVSGKEVSADYETHFTVTR